MGGTPSRRADWGSRWAREVLGDDVMSLLDGCSTSWELFGRTLADGTIERSARVVNHCHSSYCGICSTSEAHERAATWLEHFGAVARVRGTVPALMLTFTIPREVSEAIAGRDDRRAVLNALFGAVHSTMAGFSLAWVAAVHFVSSSSPSQAHVHFPVFCVPLGPDGEPIPAYLADRERFAERRRVLLGSFNRELGRVLSRFGLSGRSEVVHVGYLRDREALSRGLHYELRPPRQDCFRHSESAEELRAALDVVHGFLYPPGAKQAYRRIRPGGRFGPRALAGFFAELGLERREHSEDDGEWESLGPAYLLRVNERTGVGLFVLRRSWRFVSIPLSSCRVAAHGAGFTWARAGPPGEGGDGDR